MSRSRSDNTSCDLAVHYSSASVEWSAPQDPFKTLDAEFSFELDVCATPENAKCLRYYPRREDGLAQPWAGVALCTSSAKE